MTAVKGATVEERREARDRRRRERLAALVRRQAAAAQSAHRRLVVACNYVLAVGKNLPDDEERALAEQVAQLADERNR